MRTVVVGMGEIGSALAKVLSPVHDVLIADVNYGPDVDKSSHIEVLNICFPYSDSFVDDVKIYQAGYNPNLTIIHSTVPIGITRLIGGNAVHSPVVGRHPNLEGAIQTFTKAIGATDQKHADFAAEFFNMAGIFTTIFESPETTETAKLMSTLRLGVDVMFQKAVKKFCVERDLDFNQVYSSWTENYNRGYVDIDEPWFQRPLITNSPGPIGGHCVLANAEILADCGFAPAVEMLKSNKLLEEEA